jgi:hypothetical protein
MKQIPLLGIGRHRTKFICHGDLASGIYASLAMTCCMSKSYLNRWYMWFRFQELESMFHKFLPRSKLILTISHYPHHFPRVLRKLPVGHTPPLMLMPITCNLGERISRRRFLETL